MKHSLLTAAGFLWQRKWGTLGTGAAVLTSAYAVTYAIVEFQESPTNRFQSTSSSDMYVAYRTHEGIATREAPVVLVHGAPADASSWNRLLGSEAAKRSDARFIAIDRLGYGNSTPGAQLSLEQHAESLLPFIEEGTILVGHSYGGPVVLRAAAMFADRIDGVVIVAGACDPFMKDAQGVRRAVDAIAPIVPEPWEVANRELLALTEENRAMEAHLDRIRCPVEVIHGTWDPVCPHDGTVAYLERALPNADVNVVSLHRAGHNIHLDHPNEVINAVERIRGGEW